MSFSQFDVTRRTRKGNFLKQIVNGGIKRYQIAREECTS